MMGLAGCFGCGFAWVKRYKRAEDCLRLWETKGLVKREIWKGGIGDVSIIGCEIWGWCLEVVGDGVVMRQLMIPANLCEVARRKFNDLKRGLHVNFIGEWEDKADN